MKLRSSETIKRRPVPARELLNSEPGETALVVEDMITPETWQKVREFIPKTLRFKPVGYQQEYETSMYLCMACPEQCRNLSLEPRLEKNLRQQLSKYKKEGQRGLWLLLLLCAHTFFPEKKDLYSVQHLWPELLRDDELKKSGTGSYWLKVGLLMNHPTLREQLVDEDFLVAGKKMADRSSESYMLTREYPLLFFSPEYRQGFKERFPLARSPQAMETELQRLSKEIREGTVGVGVHLDWLMEKITLFKILAAESITFEEDQIHCVSEKKPLLQHPTLPTRLQL